MDINRYNFITDYHGSSWDRINADEWWEWQSDGIISGSVEICWKYRVNGLPQCPGMGKSGGGLRRRISALSTSRLALEVKSIRWVLHQAASQPKASWGRMEMCTRLGNSLISFEGVSSYHQLENGETGKILWSWKTLFLLSFFQKGWLRLDKIRTHMITYCSQQSR